MADFPLALIARTILQTYPFYLIHILFWVIMILVFSQYKKMAGRERELFGTSKNSPLRQTLISAFFGIGAGLLVSLIMVSLGINLMSIGIVFVLPIVILMMLIHPRYMCFAYGGGVVGILSLFFSLLTEFWPVLAEVNIINALISIDIPGLISLIALLHLTEAVLILLSGSIGPSPLYVKHEQKGVVGGFSLQKFWPLPFVGLISRAPDDVARASEAVINMPEWWPLFGTGVEEASGMFFLLPVAAILGYGDLSVSTTPKEKTRWAGKYLALYSLILLGLGIASVFFSPITLLGVLFSPIGHELLIIKGKNEEFEKEPIYFNQGEGVKVLDVYSDGLAYKMGVKPGDTIKLVNHFPVSSEEDFRTMIYASSPHLRFDIIRQDGERVALKAPLYKKDKRLGLILAPGINRSRQRYMELVKEKGLSSFLGKIRPIKRLLKWR
ncbi:PDZ domain-containing protein [Natranaerofaba carboxydovora]|uniref:PDZ domain-containing protein n=1 Tax=Natranaerofaba carboxydovora TaxID=2742683 RepID=UPI001F12C7A2|nr:PDZ domain-containing protein [Natranaerofaba carboxydovora]UMZ74933.1 Cell division topological determinant MinJ [Natranaerofaba carboxydovora]